MEKGDVEGVKKRCEREGVLPYWVPRGGFMVTPVLDVPMDQMEEIGARLKRALGCVV